jgi:hypothetical protein
MTARALAFGIWALVASASANASEFSQQRREQADVRAIFAMLLARMTPGDGWHFDRPCVFSGDWIDLDRGFSGKSLHPHALLSLREALDPKGRHPERFCDRKARNDGAKVAARVLPGDDNAGIRTADMDFSYPVFARGRRRAIVQHSGGNDVWFKNGKSDFVSSWRYVYLRKRDGVWTARFETLGIAN